MAKYDFNIIVIGAGSAGLVSAYIAAATQAKVALIEKHKMGGDCLNTGCVPSKALIKAAKSVHNLRTAQKLGIHAENISVDFTQVMQHVQQSITDIEPHDSVARYTELGVDCFQGEATLLSPHSVSVNGKIITARAIIIATGAAPMLPEVEGIGDVNALTSDTVWQLTRLPKRLLVIGGGPIGIELAQAFARLGSQVILTDKNNALLKREDAEVSSFLETQLTQEGINLLKQHTLQRFYVDADGKHAVLKHASGELDIIFDEVLVALGRVANTRGFGLENLGIQLDQQGRIQANPFLQTNIPSVYVCGDVTGPYQFTHVSSHQAWYASVNALFSLFKKFRVDYRVIPWATFCDPEVARVGLNEKEAGEKSIAYEVTRYDLTDLDRAITDASNRGFIKVLTPPGKDRILGVTIVGEHASEMLPEFILAMRHNLGLNKILQTIHVYPTLSEANKYVAGNWRKNHLPELALKFAKLFHAWRR
jgi:pyruvate/2-oxoglutarate dehydrogenase complex dihydrolipoamide dehydrogenase (E3) component